MHHIGKTVLSACAAVVALASAPALAAVNIMPTGWSLIQSFGAIGVLRAASPWGPGSTASQQFRIVDGAFMPENTQWNTGSLWWDEDPSINRSPVTTVITLDQPYTVNRFVVQADDNDSYLLEYWDGSAWQNAYAIPAVFSFGLVTRDSGLIAPITTNQLRLSATGGDNYYSVSEIQAFAFDGTVPEPATWATMLLGMVAVGWSMRARRGARAAPAA